MSGHIGGDGFLGWLGPYSPDNSDPIQDALAELEMAAWVISSLVNGHITGRELPDCHVWAIARRYWECLEDGHLDYIATLEATDVVTHIERCAA